MVNMHDVGHIGRIVQLLHGAVIHMQLIDHAGRGGDEVDIKFALNALANNFQMQQPQKTAAKAKAQSGRGFHFKIKTRIIQPELGHGLAQIFKLRRIGRKQAAKNHRL